MTQQDMNIQDTWSDIEDIKILKNFINNMEEQKHDTTEHKHRL